MCTEQQLLLACLSISIPVVLEGVRSRVVLLNIFFLEGTNEEKISNYRV